jgi:hypothetical protein
MLADWIGAGKAMGKPDTLAWYLKNRAQQIVHCETQEWLEVHLLNYSIGERARTRGR